MPIPRIYADLRICHLPNGNFDAIISMLARHKYGNKDMLMGQPKWRKVEYSKGDIRRAGEILKNSNASVAAYDEAVQVLDNWRAAHAIPLHTVYMRLRKIGAGHGVIVAQRLKRLNSIVDKLRREDAMSLLYMNDLGGCRCIAQTIMEAYYCAEKYNSSRIRHERLKVYDYIQSPKASGYRSLHVVYKYHGDQRGAYDDMRVEIQFRTHLQHVWAIAVETLGTYSGQSLKSGQGDETTLRFFALTSALFARLERAPAVPNTPSDLFELVDEIECIDKQINIIRLLANIKFALQTSAQEHKNKRGYFLLSSARTEHTIRMKFFAPCDVDKAMQLYSQLNQTARGADRDAVLVRVDPFQAIQAAYPNYFADLQDFIDVVESFIGFYRLPRGM